MEQERYPKILLTITLVLALIVLFAYAAKITGNNVVLKQEISNLNITSEYYRVNSFIDNALLDIHFINWGENYYNSSEVIFSFWIYNFGEVEAKNVEVTCFQEKKGVKIEKTIENIGNIASNSVEYKEIYGKNKKNPEEITGYCYVSDCDNCQKLWERIPQLQEELYDGEVFNYGKAA